MEEKDLQRLVKRLDVIIQLLLDRSAGDAETSKSSKVERLVSMGMGATEVAAVLGKELNYVTAILSRKGRKRKGSKK